MENQENQLGQEPQQPQGSLYTKTTSQQDYRKPQVPLPNGNTVLALGIISIVGCCCSYGVVGIICAIIALVMAKSSEETYRADPSSYTSGSYNNMKTGKTCAWVALILSIISVILTIILIIIYGMSIITDPQSIINAYS